MNNEELSQEDLDLEYTKAHRVKIIEALSADSKNVLADPKMANVYLSALADMDKVALGKKRIKSDDKKNDNAAQAAAMLAILLNDSNIRNAGRGTLPVVERVIPQLPDDHPTPKVIPGELDLHPSPLNFKTFKAAYADSTEG